MPQAAAFLVAPTIGSILTNVAIVVGAQILTSALVRRQQQPSIQRPRSLTTIRAAVTPAKWRFGRTRVYGTLTQIAWTGRRLRMCLVLGEAPIKGIVKFWVQGRRIDMSLPHDTVTTFAARTVVPGSTSSYAALNLIPFYDGQSVAGNRKIWDDWEGRGDYDQEGLDWDTDNFHMRGLAFIIVECINNNVYVYNPPELWWRTIPEFSFLVDGYLDSQGTLIQNAADVRRWWETARQGEPQSRIDQVSYSAARRACHNNNYLINGTIESTDNPEATRDALDLAWDGAVVDWAGKLRFLPGANRNVTATIDQADIVATPRVQIATDLHTRINVIDATISQSKDAEWQRQTIPAYRNEDDISRDGGELKVDLGEVEYVTDPQVMANLMARHQHSTKGYQVDVTVPHGTETDPYKYLAIAPGDFVSLSLPGISSRTYMVHVTTPNDDDTLSLSLQEVVSGRYTVGWHPPPVPDDIVSTVSRIDIQPRMLLWSLIPPNHIFAEWITTNEADEWAISLVLTVDDMDEPTSYELQITVAAVVSETRQVISLGQRYEYLEIESRGRSTQSLVDRRVRTGEVVVPDTITGAALNVMGLGGVGEATLSCDRYPGASSYVLSWGSEMVTLNQPVRGMNVSHTFTGLTAGMNDGTIQIHFPGGVTGSVTSVGSITVT